MIRQHANDLLTDRCAKGACSIYDPNAGCESLLVVFQDILFSQISAHAASNEVANTAYKETDNEYYHVKCNFLIPV